MAEVTVSGQFAKVMATQKHTEHRYWRFCHRGNLTDADTHTHSVLCMVMKQFRESKASSNTKLYKLSLLIYIKCRNYAPKLMQQLEATTRSSRQMGWRQTACCCRAYVCVC